MQWIAFLLIPAIMLALMIVASRTLSLLRSRIIAHMVIQLGGVVAILMEMNRSDRIGENEFLAQIVTSFLLMTCVGVYGFKLISRK